MQPGPKIDQEGRERHEIKHSIGYSTKDSGRRSRNCSDGANGSRNPKNGGAPVVTVLGVCCTSLPALGRRALPLTGVKAGYTGQGLILELAFFSEAFVDFEREVVERRRADGVTVEGECQG